MLFSLRRERHLATGNTFQSMKSSRATADLSGAIIKTGIKNIMQILSVLTLLRYPFHPSVTAVARKRSRSFCQTCRWQVTAKHAYTLRMWLCLKWHGAWLYGVHRTCAETAANSCGTSHASAVSTPLRWIFKNALWKLVTYVELHARAMSLLKSGE